MFRQLANASLAREVQERVQDYYNKDLQKHIKLVLKARKIQSRAAYSNSRDKSAAEETPVRIVDIKTNRTLTSQRSRQASESPSEIKQNPYQSVHDNRAVCQKLIKKQLKTLEPKKVPHLNSTKMHHSAERIVSNCSLNTLVPDKNKKLPNKSASAERSFKSFTQMQTQIQTLLESSNHAKTIL